MKPKNKKDSGYHGNLRVIPPTSPPQKIAGLSRRLLRDKYLSPHELLFPHLGFAGAAPSVVVQAATTVPWGWDPQTKLR